MVAIKRDTKLLEDIGVRLTALRAHYKLRPNQVAKIVGFTHASLHDYENARASIPVTRLVALAKIYDVSIDWILAGAGWGGVQVYDFESSIKLGIPIPMKHIPRFGGVKLERPEAAPVQIRQFALTRKSREKPPAPSIKTAPTKKESTTSRAKPKGKIPAEEKKGLTRKTKRGKMTVDFTL